jgi:hypothetical protein
MLSKNAAVAELSKKSKSLHKVVQPRGAYKIGSPKESKGKEDQTWLLYKNSEDSFFRGDNQTIPKLDLKFNVRSRSIIPESDRLESLRI